MNSRAASGSMLCTAMRRVNTRAMSIAKATMRNQMLAGGYCCASVIGSGSFMLFFFAEPENSTDCTAYDMGEL